MQPGSRTLDSEQPFSVQNREGPGPCGGPAGHGAGRYGGRCGFRRLGNRDTARGYLLYGRNAAKVTRGASRRGVSACRGPRSTCWIRPLARTGRNRSPCPAHRVSAPGIRAGGHSGRIRAACGIRRRARRRNLRHGHTGTPSGREVRSGPGSPGGVGDHSGAGIVSLIFVDLIRISLGEGEKGCNILRGGVFCRYAAASM